MNRVAIILLGVFSSVFFLCAGFSLAWPIPDSGQTKCYDMEGNEINCAGTGQDGEFLINPRSYTKMDANGNDLPDTAGEWAMVRDNVTGLIWEVKTDDGSIQDKDNEYTWNDAMSVFIPGLNAERLGGHSDWRLPTLVELASIANLGRLGPAIDKSYFSNTVSSYYWSSTTYAGHEGYAWLVGFDYGYDGSDDNKSSSRYVRAVRGGQVRSFDHLVINDDDTATDTQTGLMWQRATLDIEMDWDIALAHCNGLSLGGYDDWRLPTREELRSIVDYDKYKPAIDESYFPNTVSSDYWSSTTGADYEDYAWFVHFYYGYGGYYNDKSYSRYVRAVRGGQVRSLGHLVIFAPRQADFLETGTQLPITWNPQDIPGNVNIFLSRDGGKTYNSIAASTPNDGAYNWSVTSPASHNCVLKIEPLNDPSKSTSQGLFTILQSENNGPENDHFANATPLFGQTIQTTGTNINATLEPNEPTHLFKAANHSVWWAWTPDHDGFAFLDTHGSDFDTVLAVYTGASLDALDTVASNDDDGGENNASGLIFQAVAGETYRIAVSGYENSAGNIQLNLRQTGLVLESVQPDDGVFGQPLDVAIIGDGFDADTVVSMYPDGDPSQETVVSSAPESAGRIAATLTPLTPGHYTLKAANGTDADVLTSAVVFVTPENSGILNDKALIINNGNGPGGDISTETKWCADAAFGALINQGYDEGDVFYLTSETTSAGRDAAPSQANLDSVWNHFLSNPPNRLVVYMVGHGDAEGFWINPFDKLSAETLDEKLDAIEGIMPAPVIFILDACESGAFIDHLKDDPATDPAPKNPRIIVTSSKANEKAEFQEHGSLTFSSPFWDFIDHGYRLDQAFFHAQGKIDDYQTPRLDADRNGVKEEPADYEAAAIYLGSQAYNPAMPMPHIVSVSPTIQNRTLSINVCVSEPVDAVRISVIPPDPRFSADFFSAGAQPLSAALSDADGDACYDGALSLPNNRGAFMIIVRAENAEGNNAVPRYSAVTQNDGDNASLPDDYETDDSAETARPILLNDEVQRHGFHEVRDHDWATFKANDQSGYRITAGNPSAICNPVIELYSERDTTTLFLSSDKGFAGDAEILYWTCNAPGRYFIKVRNADPDVYGENVKYELGVTLAEGPPILSLQFNIVDFVTGEGIGDAVIASAELDIAESPTDADYACFPDGVCQMTSAAQLGDHFNVAFSRTPTHLPFNATYTIDESRMVITDNVCMMPVNLSGAIALLQMATGTLQYQIVVDGCAVSADVNSDDKIGLEEVLYIIQNLD